jgi:hypothetical protein
MRLLYRPALFVLVVTLLSSCEFRCNVGEISEKRAGGQKGPVVKNGAVLYNGISLDFQGIKLAKAYLVFENGQRVPPDNIIDFSSPVKIVVFIDSGWVERDGKVLLGASEKIIAENGQQLLDEEDLFRGKYDNGISAADAKVIGLTATINMRKGEPPGYFTITFRIWDKNGSGYVKGFYRLTSK